MKENQIKCCREKRKKDIFDILIFSSLSVSVSGRFGARKKGKQKKMVIISEGRRLCQAKAENKIKRYYLIRFFFCQDRMIDNGRIKRLLFANLSSVGNSQTATLLYQV